MGSYPASLESEGTIALIPDRPGAGRPKKVRAPFTGPGGDARSVGMPARSGWEFRDLPDGRTREDIRHGDLEYPRGAGVLADMDHLHRGHHSLHRCGSVLPLLGGRPDLEEVAQTHAFRAAPVEEEHVLRTGQGLGIAM